MFNIEEGIMILYLLLTSLAHGLSLVIIRSVIQDSVDHMGIYSAA